MKVRLPSKLNDRAPIVETRLGPTPDAQAFRATQTGDAARWDDVARALGFPTTWDAVVSTYFVELAKNPNLAIDGDSPAAIVAARDIRKVRWLRIAVYANLAGEGTVKSIYAAATKIDPSTTAIPGGRIFAETRDGRKAIDDRDFQTKVKALRKSGSRGDAKTAGRAKDALTKSEAAKAKREARKAKATS